MGKIVFLIGLMAPAAFANREVSTAHLGRRAYMVYPGTVGDATPLGGVLATIVSVKNVSSVPQPVTVVLAEGTYGYSNLDNSKVCMTRGGFNKQSYGTGVFTLGAGNEISTPLTIAPNSVGQAVFIATFKSPSTPTLRSWTILWYPIIKVIVGKDTGAVTATVTMHVEDNTVSTGQGDCALTGAVSATNLQSNSAMENQISPVFAMNGGRPF